MPLPRTLLDAPLVDLDLEVIAGSLPAGLRGEVFFSAPVVDRDSWNINCSGLGPSSGSR
ncbi:MAG: hypothetical protein N2037_04215 [Acidimicrobiales bacterium]|nr:hypothetical protein [Acidimicrobiales bacterium]